MLVNNKINKYLFLYLLSVKYYGEPVNESTALTGYMKYLTYDKIIYVFISAS